MQKNWNYDECIFNLFLCHHGEYTYGFFYKFIHMGLSIFRMQMYDIFIFFSSAEMKCN
jgi:hypothetical protein